MDDRALLERLAGLLPPPTSVPPWDWPAVEAALGATLPPDYKAFCERWGTGDIETSGPVSVYRLPDEAAPYQAILAEEREDEMLLFPVFPSPGGLLLWGESESETRLLWRTAPRPEDWEVVVLFVDELVSTGLPFVAWLVAALEQRLPAEHVPPELRFDDPDEDDAPRWSAAAHDLPEEPGDDPRPEDVIAGWGSEEHDGRLTLVVEVDFGVLGVPRRQALDAFLAGLEPALAGRVLGGRLRDPRDGEVVLLRDEDAVEPVMRAAVAFAEVRLGVPADPDAIDELLRG